MGIVYSIRYRRYPLNSLFVHSPSSIPHAFFDFFLPPSSPLPFIPPFSPFAPDSFLFIKPALSIVGNFPSACACSKNCLHSSMVPAGWSSCQRTTSMRRNLVSWEGLRERVELRRLPYTREGFSMHSQCALIGIGHTSTLGFSSIALSNPSSTTFAA